MKIPVSILLTVLLSIDTFAAPVPTADGSELALGARKAVAKKPAVKPAPKPVAKPKPVPKPAPKKATPAPKATPAKKPVAAPPAKVPAPAKPPAKKPVAAPPAKLPPQATPAKKPVAAPPAKVPAPAKPPVKKPVAAPPAKQATPAKKPTTAPTKAVPSKVAAPAKSATAKTPAKSASAAKPSASKLPECSAAQIEARELEARVSLKHPSGTGEITLFHGTTAANAALLASGVDLSKTRGTGDFNHKPEVPGGFYLSDSLVAAAQFACFGIPGKAPASVAVVEYTWNGAGQQVHTFPGETQDWKDFQVFNQNPNVALNTKSPFFAQAQALFKNQMIVGPLNGPVDKDLTDSFQQYAVINQNSANNNLKLVTNHPNVLCKNIPKGNELTNGLYQQGQGGNAKFTTRLAKLQDPNFKPGKGLCVIQ